MKILHITPSYKPAYVYGGPTRSLAQLCEAQAAAGWEVEVITTLANGAEELPYTPSIPHENNRVKVVYYTRWTGDHSHLSPALLWNLFMYIRQVRYVHIHSWWNLVSIPAALICLLSGRRPIVSPRGMLSPYTLQSGIKRFFHKVCGRFMLRRTLLHATSNQELEEAQSVVPKWKGVVVGNLLEYPQFDSGRYHNLLPDETVQLHLIYVSRIHPKKGLDLLFEALPQCDFPWKLSVVGEGELEYVEALKSKAQILDMSDRIHWLGWLDGEAKTAAIFGADLMVLPSHNENFAHVVPEALAVGTAVVISDQVGLKDYVLKNDLGWVHALTSESLHQALQLAWMDSSKRDRIRQMAPALIRRDFDPQELVRQYQKAYELL